MKNFTVKKIKIDFYLSLLIFIFPNFVLSKPILSINQKIESKSVKSGKNLEGKLVLKNKGDELLKIHGVSSSCGCTTFKLKKRMLNPGEEVDLNFIVDTRGKLGMVEKTITFHSNTGESPKDEIVIFHALPYKSVRYA